MALRLAQERTDIGSVNAMPAVDFTLFDRVGLPRSLAQARIDVSVVAVGPGPTQSPAHSFVPRTVPTSLQPAGAFGFT